MIYWIKYKKKKKKILRWKKVDILIIDEISLISPILFDKLEYIARIIRQNDKPFGGIQIILSGDWLQLPNINSNTYTFDAKSWNKSIDTIIYLKDIQRQKDITFQNVLNSIRVGRITNEVKKVLRSRLNVNLENKYGIIPTEIYTLNQNVDKINKLKLENLIKKNNLEKKVYDIKWIPNTKKKLEQTNIDNYFRKKNNEETEINPDLSIDTEIDFNINKIDKYFNMTNAEKSLELCIGAQIMLITNLNQEEHLVNGSKGIILEFNDENYPIVQFLNGSKTIIENKLWEIEINNKVIGYVKQIPLKLAYGTTIHKCQGSTLDYVNISLKNIFELSQAYVGLSRVSSLEGLSINDLDFSKFRVNLRALEFYKNLENSA